MSTQWHPVCPADEFPEDGKAVCAAGAWHVLVVRDGDEFRAYNDCCTHQASRLSPGRVRRNAIMCPLHGARFEISTGRCIGGTYPALRAFDVRVEAGMIEVATPDEKPGQGEIAVS